MSGGPYGRGKAPERACLKLDRWPDLDSALWRAACAPGSLLDEEVGARCDYAKITNEKDSKGYGRWLNYLLFHDAPALKLSAAKRITPERVRTYVERLEALGASTHTVLARLQELGAAARVMDPRRDWSFINRLAARVRARNKPARDKTCHRLSHELVDLGLRLMAGAGPSGSLMGAIQHRDGLIIALLALVPLRRRNLADLELGRSLIANGDTFLIVFAERETKTGAPLELLLPDILKGPMRDHIDLWRPVLAGRRGRWTRRLGKALWVSSDASPMTQIALYDRIRARTRDAFGAPINPHAFRHAAATTQAIADPANVRVAAPLLGHRTFTTTERYYQQASAYEAHRSFIEVIDALRDAANG